MLWIKVIFKIQTNKWPTLSWQNIKIPKCYNIKLYIFDLSVSKYILPVAFWKTAKKQGLLNTARPYTYKLSETVTARPGLKLLWGLWCPSSEDGSGYKLPPWTQQLSPLITVCKWKINFLCQRLTRHANYFRARLYV